MKIKITGTSRPSRKQPDDLALWKRTDPIWLLRQCLGNKLRSKHWRSAHFAKKKWLDAFTANVCVEGSPVEAPALVVIRHALPRCPDVDAPVKVILDAIQEMMFVNGDDSSVGALIIVREKPDSDPYVSVEATSFSGSPFRTQQLASDALRDAHIALTKDKDK
jgi:hypothetical protein